MGAPSAWIFPLLIVHFWLLSQSVERIFGIQALKKGDLLCSQGMSSKCELAPVLTAYGILVFVLFVRSPNTVLPWPNGERQLYLHTSRGLVSGRLPRDTTNEFFFQFRSDNWNTLAGKAISCSWRKHVIKSFKILRDIWYQRVNQPQLMQREWRQFRNTVLCPFQVVYPLSFHVVVLRFTVCLSRCFFGQVRQRIGSGCAT